MDMNLTYGVKFDGDSLNIESYYIPDKLKSWVEHDLEVSGYHYHSGVMYIRPRNLSHRNKQENSVSGVCYQYLRKVVRQKRLLNEYINKLI